MIYECIVCDVRCQTNVRPTTKDCLLGQILATKWVEIKGVENEKYQRIIEHRVNGSDRETKGK